MALAIGRDAGVATGGIRPWRQRRLADVGRHARPQHGLEHEGAADRLGRQDEEEREVGRRARIAELRQPGRRRRHGVRRHEQRGAARSEAAGRPRRADGVPRIDRRVPVAADAREARRRAAPTTGRIRASPRRRSSKGTQLYYTSNRGVVWCLDINGFRDGKNDGPVTDEKLTGPARRRRDLVVRHDGRSRIVSRTTCRTRRR